MRSPFLLGALAAFSLGCNVIAPPPLMPQLGGTAPNAPGDVRILLAVGLGGGIWVDGGAFGELRVESQITEWATVGGGLAGGMNLEHRGETPARQSLNHPRFLYAARTWGRFNPGTLDWLALTAGAGIAGTDTGTVALTLDESTIFGYPIEVSRDGFRLTPYGGPALALSIPVRQGESIREPRFELGLGPDMRPGSSSEPVPYSTTFFVGAQGGLAVDGPRASAYTGAIEILSLGAFSATDNAALFSIALGQGARFHP